MQNERLVDEKQAAQILAVAPATLRVWRCTGRVPLRYVKVGSAVRYRIDDLTRFIESRTRGGERSQ
jgi:predicted site-specific integrase-resolvase